MTHIRSFWISTGSSLSLLIRLQEACARVAQMSLKGRERVAQGKVGGRKTRPKPHKAEPFKQKRSVRLCSIFVSSTTPICLHLGVTGCGVDSWETNGPSAGISYINSSAFIWASTILISEAVFLQQFSLCTTYISGLRACAIQHASPTCVCNKAFHFPPYCKQPCR